MDRQLSIIVCTRNRPVELTRAIWSVIKAGRECGGNIEVIIVDDGDLPPVLVQHLTNILTEVSIPLVYVKKASKHNLFASRLIGLKQANYETVLFIDDDVEIDQDYINVLFETYEMFPSAVGVGGVDVLMKRASLWRQAWEILIFYRSLDRGKLSASGFGGSMDKWIAAKSPFRTEFLSGCNMSFRKEALKNIAEKKWLQGYSLGEDLYLSFIARQNGILVINPNMKVKHYRSMVSRDNAEAIAYSQIVNHFELLREYNAPKIRYITFLVTTFGIMALYAARMTLGKPAGREQFRGGIQGVWYILREISQKKRL
jgi:glycosyltransferase involved in cell wall biosynthesis